MDKPAPTTALGAKAAMPCSHTLYAAELYSLAAPPPANVQPGELENEVLCWKPPFCSLTAPKGPMREFMSLRATTTPPTVSDHTT